MRIRRHRCVPLEAKSRAVRRYALRARPGNLRKAWGPMRAGLFSADVEIVQSCSCAYPPNGGMRTARIGDALVPRTRSSHYNCRESGCELRVQSGTRIIELLVSYDSEVRFRACGKVGRTSESGHLGSTKRVATRFRNASDTGTIYDHPALQK